MITTISGFLEIDHDRGVVYFHSANPEATAEYGVVTILRISSLPTPVPIEQQLDITHLVGTSWSKPDAKDSI